MSTERQLVAPARAADGSSNLSSVQFSFFAVPPRSLHHRLKGRLRAPRSTQVLSTRSLGLLNFASPRGAVGSGPVAVESAAASVVSLTCGMCVVGAWWVWMVVRSSSAWSVCLCAPACPVSRVCPVCVPAPPGVFTPVNIHRGEPGHTQDTHGTRGGTSHKGTRTAQTNLTTLQTHQQHPTRGLGGGCYQDTYPDVS